MRRAGRVLTGIDRVELAYLNAVITDPVPAFALIRTPLGYILLDQAGMSQLVNPLSELASDSPGRIQQKRILRTARQMALGRIQG